MDKDRLAEIKQALEDSPDAELGATRHWWGELINEVELLTDRIARVRQLCLDKMVESTTGGLTDADTIWPSEVLYFLKQDD